MFSIAALTWDWEIKLMNTTWKVSVFGIILIRIFPHSSWIRRYSVRMQENTGQNNSKYQYLLQNTRKGSLWVSHFQEAFTCSKSTMEVWICSERNAAEPSGCRCFTKKKILNISKNSQKNNWARVSLIIQLQAEGCIKEKRLHHRCFPVNFAKMLRTHFFKNNSELLL